MNAIMQWFDDPRLVRLGLSLVHFLWQGALLGVAAAILMTWMRGASSRRRYAVLLMAFFGMAIAPVVTFLMLPSPRKPIEPANIATSAILPAQKLVSKAFVTTATPIAPRATPSSQIDNGAETRAAAAPAIGFAARISLAWAWIVGHLSWFVAAWAAGVCLFSVRLMIGLGGASRVRRIGVTPVPADCQAWSAELATTIGIRRPINVGQSVLVKVPVVVGWLRPIVLLPASVITGLPEPELRAILAHELAHIRRHDYLVNTLQTIVETLLFYHPAVWWLSNAIRQEREQCCDDLAADACGDRVVVAKALVRLAEVRALAAPAALAATGGRLARRIRRLLVKPRDSKRPTPWRSLAGSGLAALLTAAVVITVNALAGEFAESKATAQESTPQGENIQNATRAESDSEASNAKADHAAKGLPALSQLPFVSRLFTMPATEDAGQTEKPISKADELKSVLRNVEKANERAQRELLRAQQQLRAEQDKSDTERQQEAKDLLPLKRQIAEKEREVQEKLQLIEENRRALNDLLSRRQAELKRAAETDPRHQRQLQLREQEDADLRKLEGTWEGTLKIDGKEPIRLFGSNLETWVFHGHHWANYTGHARIENPAQEESQWLFFVNPNKSEKEMTIFGKNILIQAIYRLDGDTLTVCSFGRPEVDRPTSFEPTKDDVLPHVVRTFRRIKPDPKQSF